MNLGGESNNTSITRQKKVASLLKKAGKKQPKIQKLVPSKGERIEIRVWQEERKRKEKPIAKAQMGVKRKQKRKKKREVVNGDSQCGNIRCLIMFITDPRMQH